MRLKFSWHTTNNQRSMSLKRKVSQVWDWNLIRFFTNLIKTGFTWKEKYLKYEIEICQTVPVTLTDRSLKRKVSQVWDWNKKYVPTLTKNQALEKKSISSMRLKSKWAQSFRWCLPSCLEKKSISSMRLKWVRRYIGTCGLRCPWKEKYLKYEIEMLLVASITINTCIFLKRKVSQVWDWNLSNTWLSAKLFTLEKKSISSMRLKYWFSLINSTLRWNLKRKVSQVWDWNVQAGGATTFGEIPWKEKYLKYEIEIDRMQHHPVLPHYLKRKVSQVWDWNSS